MKNIKRTKTELSDRGFSQKIAAKYTNLQLFSTNFLPVISTRRIIPRMRWLELVYAMPYVVLRREILKSFKKTKNVLTSSVKQIWNIFLRFEFPLSRYDYITTRLHRVSREFKSSSMELAPPGSLETTGLEMEKESTIKNYLLPVVMHQPLTVSYKPPAVHYEDQATYILTSASDFIEPLFSYYSFNPAYFLGQKTGPVKQREVLLNLQKSDYHPYAHVERETSLNGQRIISQLKQSSMELAPPGSLETTGLEMEKESTIKNYLLPVVMHQPLTVSHKPPAVHYQKSDYHPYAHVERETSLNGQRIISQLNFKTSSMELAPPVSPETTGLEMEKESAVKNYLLPVVMHQPLTVSHKPPAVHYQKSDYHPYAHVERETSLNGQRIISQLNFKTSSMELAPPVSPETTGLEMEKESAVKNYQLSVVMHQPLTVSHKPPAVHYEDQATYILTSASDFISYYSFNPAFFLKQKIGLVKQREVLLNLQKSDAHYHPYAHLERETSLNGQKIFSQLKQSSMELAQPVSPKNTSEVEKAPIYHTYPEIEHVTSTHTEILKERVIEKEEESKPPQVSPQLPGIDVNRLADQVYSVIERKIRIEKERRGFYG